MVAPLRLMMSVAPPRAWNVGTIAEAEAAAAERVVETLARVTLPGDMDTRYATGSRGARLLIRRGQELLAVLTPAQIGEIVRYWKDNGVGVDGP